MSTISQIKEECQSKISAMLAELGVFFAFSNQQFDEHKKEGVTYVQMGMGMIAPKENAKLVREAIDRINAETGEAYRERVPINEYILYELYNHECFYTGNYSEILELVQFHYPDCTIENIWEVYQANINNAE